MNKILTVLITLLFVLPVKAQYDPDSSFVSNEVLDSLYILETEAVPGRPKVLHAEPLFIDLIRDLGARKGEREWNVGFGMTDQKTFDNYSALVEYEFAPIDRLGLEVELPFAFYYPIEKDHPRDQIPYNKLKSFKLASQYSFFVSEKWSTSVAVGYIHEFSLTSFRNYGKKNIFEGNVYNPFLVAAKRWGDKFHTMVYQGPVFENIHGSATHLKWQFNTNIHYMISGTRNFIGIEFNKDFGQNDFDMTVRPQMRLGITHNLLIGIVTGIPIDREVERFSTFFRLIYEPGVKRHG